QRAAVAHVRPGAIADQTTLVIVFVEPQVLTLRTDPCILLLAVLEPRRAIAERAPVRVCGEPLEDERAPDESPRVASGDDRLGAHVTFAAAASSPLTAASPLGWVTSVKRMSSGSSSVTRLTVWRIPIHAMYSTGSAPPTMKTMSPGSRSHSMRAFVSFVRNARSRASQ